MDSIASQDAVIDLPGGATGEEAFCIASTDTPTKVPTATADPGEASAALGAAIIEEAMTLHAQAEALALPGLQEVCMQVIQNACLLCDGINAPPESAHALLEWFPALARDYLERPGDAQAAEMLIAFLGADFLPDPPAPAALESLYAALCNVPAAAPAAGEPDTGLPGEPLAQPTAPAAEAATGDDTDDSPAFPEDAFIAAAAPLSPVDSAPIAPCIAAADDDGAVAVAPTFPAGGAQAAPCADAPPPAPPLQRVAQELIEMLAGELAGVQSELAHLLPDTLSAGEPSERNMDAVAACADTVERLAMAADAVGLSALKDYLLTLHGCIGASGGMHLSTAQSARLASLPGALLAYLAAPSDPSTAEGLLDLLRGECWELAPAPDHCNALRTLLSSVEVGAGLVAMEARVAAARAEDVALTLPDDLSQELLDGLLQEIPIQTADFSAAIHRIATGSGNLLDVNAAKRAAHTLKGAANTVGLPGIANLTHHVEDILEALSRHHAMPGRSMAAMLTTAGDCLEAMGEAVMGTGPEPDDALQVLQDVLDWANRIDHEGLPADDALPAAAEPPPASPPSAPASPLSTPDTPPPTATAGHSAAAAGAADSAAQGAAAGGAADSAAQGAAAGGEAMIRVPAGLVDELLRLVGESIISSGQLHDRLKRLQRRNRDIRTQNSAFLHLAMELEELADLRGSRSGPHAAQGHAAFDPLEFEHYSELHTISRRMIEAATDCGELSGEMEGDLGGLGELVEGQHRLHDDTQNVVMRTRMVPVSTVVARLQRSVRQASRLLDKVVSLEVHGADTLIDSNILGELVDPLMHMLRNAVDHGIESAARRSAAGKPHEGRIALHFAREGNQVVVRCRDDGAGLDLAAVRQSAIAKALLQDDHTPTDDELARLILAPGFSTRQEATQMSGRGVGMDVVHSRVLQLKGTLGLRSHAGHGLEIELRLPAMLIATHALLVRAAGQVLAISNHGVEDLRYITPDQLQQIGDKTFFRLGEELKPLVDLDALLHTGAAPRAPADGFPALLVRDDSGTTNALRVHEIIDSRSLVVKGLGRYVPKPHGVVGATILGDGSVAAVVDIPELMRSPAQARAAWPSAAAQPGQGVAPPTEATRRSALVVDDSLSARRATAQFMKDAGFEVRSAIDGLDAVSLLEQWTPDILLVDMEMPRMNGLELTAHIRARADTAHIPVIMITSRSTDKHRHQAQSAGVNIYLTKPFGDDELLRHVVALSGGHD